MLTSELLGMTIAWLLAAIVISLFLWMLVLIWGHMIQAIKALFGVVPPSVGQPHDHYQAPVSPPVPQDGYARRDFQ